MSYGVLAVILPFAVLIGAIVLYVFQDVMPAWRTGIALGPFEFIYYIRRTNSYIRKRFNLIELTDVILDHDAGKSMIEFLKDEFDQPDFYLIGMKKEEAIKELESVATKTAKGDNVLISQSGYRLRVFGLRSLTKGRSLMITFLKDDISFPDSYAMAVAKKLLSFTGVNRRLLTGRRFDLKHVIDFNFAGLGKNLKSFFFVPFNKNAEAESQQFGIMEKFADLIAPIVPIIAQTRLRDTELKAMKTENKELKRENGFLTAKTHSVVAQARSVDEASKALEDVEGSKGKTVRGALTPIIMFIGTVGGAVVFQYGFQTNPILGVVTGYAMSMLIVASVRR